MVISTVKGEKSKHETFICLNIVFPDATITFALIEDDKDRLPRIVSERSLLSTNNQH